MRHRRIVVGIDFSERSLAAARWVATHFAPEAEIVLVHVMRGPEPPPFLEHLVEPMLDVVTEVAPALYAGLRGFADLIGGDRTWVDMRDGAPAEALVRAAEETEADLICVGRQHRRRGSARFGASTAQRIMTRSRLPLLVVPSVPPMQPARVLAPIDDRVETRTLLTSASALAREADAQLDLLHVLGPELHGFVRACRADGPHGAPVSRELELLTGQRYARIHDEEHLFRLTRAWIESELGSVGAAPRRVETQVRVGDAGQEIVAFAHANRVDMIVLGRGGPNIDLERHEALPVGSTTRLVSWAAPCPVLVLPPESARRRDSPRPRGRARMGPCSTADRIPVTSIVSNGFPPAASARPAMRTEAA